jgi:hypothetical protein
MSSEQKQLTYIALDAEDRKLIAVGEDLLDLMLRIEERLLHGEDIIVRAIKGNGKYESAHFCCGSSSRHYCVGSYHMVRRMFATIYPMKILGLILLSI